MRARCLCSRICGGIDLRLDIGSQHADIIKERRNHTCNGIVLGGEKSLSCCFHSYLYSWAIQRSMSEYTYNAL